MGKRILLADDDDNIRLLLMEILGKEGYSVSAVDNGLDLLRLASSSRGFDLIITDICMPLGEGADMLSVMREKKINIPAILITGEDNCVAPKGIPLLKKPFKASALLQLVASALPRGEYADREKTEAL